MLGVRMSKCSTRGHSLSSLLAIGVSDISVLVLVLDHYSYCWSGFIISCDQSHCYDAIVLRCENGPADVHSGKKGYGV